MKGALHIISGTAEKRVIPLEVGKYTIGRGTDVDIQIVSHQVSRKHAEIIVENDRVSVVDCGSANGTAINGKFVTSGNLRDRDQLIIGEVVLEFRDSSSLRKRVISSEPFVDRPSMYVAATKVIADKLRPKALWPLFTCLFTLGFLVLEIAAGLSFRSLLRDRLNREAMLRAQNIVRYLAEKNREDLRLKNELLLDVSGVLSEKGVREAIIVNAKGRILAPISKLNQTEKDPFVAEALAQNNDRSILPSPKALGGTHVFVHPIRAYNDKSGKYEILGVAKIIFAPSEAIGPIEEVNQLLYLMLAAAILLALLFGWASAKALTMPIGRLAEKIQLWRSGQIFQKETAPFREFDPLYDAVDKALTDTQE